MNHEFISHTSIFAHDPSHLKLRYRVLWADKERSGLGKFGFAVCTLDPRRSVPLTAINVVELGSCDDPLIGSHRTAVIDVEVRGETCLVREATNGL